MAGLPMGPKTVPGSLGGPPIMGGLGGPPMGGLGGPPIMGGPGGLGWPEASSQFWVNKPRVTAITIIGCRAVMVTVPDGHGSR